MFGYPGPEVGTGMIYDVMCMSTLWEKLCYYAMLFIQLQEYESSESLWQRVKVGGVISEGEREELKSSIEEQETILHGYQKVHVQCIYML